MLSELLTNYSIGMREIFAFYRSLPVIIFGFVNTEFGLNLNKLEAISRKYFKSTFLLKNSRKNSRVWKYSLFSKVMLSCEAWLVHNVSKG